MREPAAAIIARIETAWAGWLDAIAGLDDAACSVPDTASGWSVAQAMAHVALWDRLAADNADRRAAGGPPRHVDFDALNARAADDRASQSAAAARIEMLTTHAELLLRLARLGSVEPAWVAVDTWDHYPEHAAAVRAWRQRTGH